jgi:hypothetical protein
MLLLRFICHCVNSFSLHFLHASERYNFTCFFFFFFFFSFCFYIYFIFLIFIINDTFYIMIGTDITN